jgi:acyl carrier protein
MSQHTSEVREFIESYLKKAGKEVDVTLPISRCGMDSLDLIELLMEIEERYKLEISPNEIDQTKGIDQFFAIIEDRTSVGNFG